MCINTNLNMRSNELIGTMPESTDDEQDNVDPPNTYFYQCSSDPCEILGFFQEHMQSGAMRRMIGRLTTRQEAKGSYTRLKHYVSRYHILRKYRIWSGRRAMNPIPRCVRNAIARSFPFENQRMHIYLTSVTHLVYCKATSNDGTICQGYWWQRQPNNSWFLVDTNGTEIYEENYPEEMVPLANQMVRMFWMIFPFKFNKLLFPPLHRRIYYF